MDSFKKIKEDVLDCKRCSLRKERERKCYLPVAGEGNLEAKILIVGEAPGLKEAESGKPFQGRAGKILDELMESVRMERRNVYITNILKDRPPGNRNPEKREIKSCAPFLDRQIRLIKPKAILLLGNFPARHVFERCGLEFCGISKARARAYEARFGNVKVKLIPLYHPAAAIYNPSLKKLMKSDFKKTMKLL
jgi:DNA polymerase